MKILLAVCCVLLCGVCTGFLCRTCSYSYDPNILYNDQKCIYNPTAIMGPNSYIRCNRTCIIQENFNHVLNVIESHVRTCSARQERGYCTPDTKQTTCFDSCTGDYCNDDIAVPLHQLYPVQDWQHPDANLYSNEGFLCRTCSYSYDPNILYNDQKCIYNPAAITGPNSYIRCNRRCIIRENFNHELNIIESYSRKCSSRQERGHCILDPKQTTCFDSCQGDYCNDDITVPLHQLYPVRNWQHLNVHFCSNEATTTSSPGLPVKTLVSAAMAYLCVERGAGRLRC